MNLTFKFYLLNLVYLFLFNVPVYANDTIIVRVAAYNLNSGIQATPEQLGTMLKPYHLDIIAFSEVPGGDWTKQVGKVLGMKYSLTGKISSANHRDKYKSILSKTPLRKAAEYTLAGKAKWGPASAVKAETTIKGLPVSFYSLHIAQTDKLNEGHAYLLASKILPIDSNEQIIMAGAFNNKMGGPAMHTLGQAGMRATWQDLEINLNRQTTYVEPGEKSKGVVDHILYSVASDARAVAGGIIELTEPLSDRKPVWAEIVYQTKPGTVAH